MIPFTAEVLFRLYGSYNLSIWPVQIAGYALCALAVLLAFRPFRGSDRIISAILAAFWIWTGLVFHIGHFAPINWGAWIFGALFILEGLLIAWSGIAQAKINFRFEPGARSWAGLMLIALAMAAPLFSAFAGHSWPQMQTPGTLPAPTVVLTFGLLLMLTGPRRLPLAIIPLLWAAIGGAAAAELGIAEDWVLPFSALVYTALLFTARRPSPLPSG